MIKTHHNKKVDKAAKIVIEFQAFTQVFNLLSSVKCLLRKEMIRKEQLNLENIEMRIHAFSHVPKVEHLCGNHILTQYVTKQNLQNVFEDST